jgi:amidase
MVWNALDYTTSVFPVTTVDPVLDVKQPREDFFGADDRKVYEMCMLLFLLFSTSR